MSPNGTDVVPVRTDAAAEPLPRRIPGASGHTPDRTDANRAAFTATSHTRIPTARTAPAHLTRAQLDREIAAAKTHEPYLIGYGGTQANAAFGGAQ